VTDIVSYQRTDEVHEFSLGGYLKARDVIKRLESEGWYYVGTKGSHRHYKHPTKPGKVTVAGHPNTDLPKKTLSDIKKQAGW
jgi:predicted RNA binding protein YcfA (HicA-like mRNA interferase family)